MAGASVVEELHKDHSALRNHVAALESLLQTWDGTVSGTEQTPGGTVRARLDGLGAELEVHFRREEEGLFPDAQRLVTAGAAGADHIGPATKLVRFT